MADLANPAGSEALHALAFFLNRFPARVRLDGTDYYASRAVRLVGAAGPEVLAEVDGNLTYTSVLTWQPPEWNARCTCPVGERCKHIYATGRAWLDRASHREAFHPIPIRAPGPAAVAPAPQVAPVTWQPHEQALVDEFIAASGHAPDRRELAWLRNLASLHHSSLHAAQYGWFDRSALMNLAPAAHRTRVPYDYRNPFAGWWLQPPATPLALWPFVALLFTEREIPLPPFAAAFARLDEARAAREAARREAELAEWRQRFARLDEIAATPTKSDLPRQSLRLRLGPKKWTWEIGPAGGDGPFTPFATRALQELLFHYARAADSLDDASNAFLEYLRTHQQTRGRTALAPANSEDCRLLGRLLDHPSLRPRILMADGRALLDDSRRLTWHVADHPTDPTLAEVRLAFEDGSPPPAPLLHLPGHPALTRYLAPDGAVFRGPPPPREPAKPLSAEGFATTLPRAALALPEAGRFAARAGLRLPGDAAARFRAEPLRARIRLPVIAPTARGGEETLVVELHALAPGGEARARWNGIRWVTAGADLIQPADAAFLLHDYRPLQPACDHLTRLPGLWSDGFSPDGSHLSVRMTSPTFPDDFAAWLAATPTGVVVELDPLLAGFGRPPTRAHFALEIEPSGVDWFGVQVALRAEDTSLTAEELALLHRARGRFVRLPQRGWRRLEVVSGSDDAARFDRLGLDPAAALETGRDLPQFHALQLADEALGDALPEKLARAIRDRAAEIRALPLPPISAGLTAQLRPYQVEGFHFLAHLAGNRFGGVLADDMGLGKTLQALAWLLWLGERVAADGRSLRALVVCPKSVVFNWETETARFAPSLTTARLAPRVAASVPTGTHLVVVNYAQLRLHATALAAETWDAVILDEGQNIKNPASATAAAARALKAAHRLVLTGTPVENRLLDLWSLFAFAQPGLLGGQTAFKRLYDDRTDPAAAHARLAGRVRHFLLRRTKSQVAPDLPPRSEEDIVVELEGAQRRLYEAELKRARALVLGVKSEREFDAQRFNILQSLLRLRQICCDPRLVGADLPPEPAAPPRRGRRPAAAPEHVALSPRTVSAKLEALLDTVEPLVAEGHRVLVFSQFVTMLELIRIELAAREIRYLLLTGQTENRQELVEQFQAPDGAPVFLLSLKAAGAGLNLTAASYVVLYDPWWNPAVEAQAIDRTHRIGQSAHVIAYRLLARDTVEEKIRALQKGKAALAAAVVQEESLARVLDLESLRQILA